MGVIQKFVFDAWQSGFCHFFLVVGHLVTCTLTKHNNRHVSFLLKFFPLSEINEKSILGCFQRHRKTQRSRLKTLREAEV